MRSSHHFSTYPTLAEPYFKALALKSKIADHTLTLQFLERKIEELNSPPKNLFTESKIVSAMESGPIDGGSQMTEENVTDTMGDDLIVQDLGQSVSTEIGHDHVLSMENFLARPVKIYTTTLPYDSHYWLRLNPWDMFTLVPSVRAKLRNYSYLRGTLHVRIAVAGTPFHLGRVLLSYLPMAGYNDVYNSLVTMYGVSTVNILPPINNYLSQSEGSTTIDVKENKPVDIVCPFIFNNPAFRLFNDSNAIVAAGTSFTDVVNAGILSISSLNKIRNIQEVTDPLPIYVYAWMTDVKLGTPTGTVIEVTTESKVIKKGKKPKADERKIGPVERLSTRVAEISSALTMVPSIAPFAMASEMIASSIGSIASVFGWSKPIVTTEQPSFVKNLAFQNGALGVGWDTNFKIAVDPKQEVTVDPRYGANDYDPMDINMITNRESYWHTFEWSPEDTPMSVIWWKPVTSIYMTTYMKSLGGAVNVPTSLGFMSQMFRYWRGDITFRIEVVASSFHRGKIAIFYDPNLEQRELINTTVSLNKQFLGVIDLQEAQTAEFCVNWGFYKPWAKCWPSYDSSFALTPVTADKANGFISIIPLVPLVSPDSLPIAINVYVRSDNIKYASPDTLWMVQNKTYYTESKEVHSPSLTHFSTDVSCTPLNKSSATHENLSVETMGELVPSLRLLMRRYCESESLSIAADSNSNKLIMGSGTFFPKTGTYISGTSADTRVTNFYDFLRFAFVGVRGGVKKQLLISLNALSTPHGYALITREDTADTPVTAFNVSPANPASTAWIGPKATGTITFNHFSNGGIEFELPYYCSDLFKCSFNNSYQITNRAWDDRIKGYYFSIGAIGSTAAGRISEVNAFSEDFTFLRFQGAPYSYDTIQRGVISEFL